MSAPSTTTRLLGYEWLKVPKEELGNRDLSWAIVVHSTCGYIVLTEIRQWIDGDKAGERFNVTITLDAMKTWKPYG